jgi:SAM-dependent methyltransferase
MNNKDSALNIPDILHLGCGKKKLPEAFGVDKGLDTSADLCWDLDQIPWPLPSSHFHRVHMISVLEHLEDIVSIMEEVFRICQPNADIYILSPFASSDFLWTDPTHKRGFTSRSFKYFADEFAKNHFSYSEARFNVLDVEYLVHAPKWFDRILLSLANRKKNIYERRFMYWYPVQNIYFHLQADKY